MGGLLMAAPRREVLDQKDIVVPEMTGLKFESAWLGGVDVGSWRRQPASAVSFQGLRTSPRIPIAVGADW